MKGKRVNRRWLLLAMVLMMGVVARAQRIHVVDSDGIPIAYVCVTTDKGFLIGSTDTEGYLDDVKGNKVINLSHVAFKDMVVDMSKVEDGQIIMQDVEFVLPDVEVKPKELAYVQTYFRLIYFDDDGPIYYRGGVVDNTYDFASQKVSSKTRSLSKGSNGLLRFVISTLVGRYIDEKGKLNKTPMHKRILDQEKKGYLTLTPDDQGRVVVSDSVGKLGYIEADTVAGLCTTSFNYWAYSDHRKAAEEKAKGKVKKEKKEMKQDDDAAAEESYYEVYRMDSKGRSRIDDFVMRQLQVVGRHRRSGGQYMILLQAYTTDRDYIDKKEFKQLRKDNKVDMEIVELKRFEQSHNIPVLAPDIQKQIDILFSKELNSK